MRLGISPFASTREAALDVATRAVGGGLDTLWLGEGLLHNPDFPGWSGSFEPFTELAWLGGRLPSARLGLSAAVLPLRDIAWTAKQATTLDQLTEGQFILVVAPGFWAHELQWRGVAFEERGARFDDALGALRAAFAGEPYDGRWVTIPPGPSLSPPPWTPGGPPLWLAGARATMRRALALGLPFQVSRVSPADLAPLAKEWRDAGGGLLAVRVRAEVAAEPPRGHGLAWQALTGPPGYLAEQLAGFASMGVSDVSIIPGQDDETSRRTVDALAEHVIPALVASGVASRS